MQKVQGSQVVCLPHLKQVLPFNRHKSYQRLFLLYPLKPTLQGKSELLAHDARYATFFAGMQGHDDAGCLD